jgi:hypothetical protein
MKLSKRKICALGIATAATVALFESHRSSRDQVLVQLVDRATGAPLTNLSVTAREFRRVPIFESIPWIPDSWRFTVSERSWTSPDGTFRPDRITRSSRLVHSQFVFSSSNWFGGTGSYTVDGFNSNQPGSSCEKVPASGVLILEYETIQSYEADHSR